MKVTEQDAINAFSLLRDHVNENGFLHECYNLGIGALKTVQDGNYKIESDTIPQELLDEIIDYKCQCNDCDSCKYNYEDHCLYGDAKAIRYYEEYRRRIIEWMNKNVKN